MTNPIENLFIELGVPYLVANTGLSRAAVYKWKSQGWCPYNRCKALAGISKGLVTKEQLVELIPEIEFEVNNGKKKGS